MLEHSSMFTEGFAPPTGGLRKGVLCRASVLREFHQSGLLA